MQSLPNPRAAPFERPIQDAVPSVLCPACGICQANATAPGRDADSYSHASGFAHTRGDFGLSARELYGASISKEELYCINRKGVL